MDHLAIMAPTLGLLPKILTGEKTIESRWSTTKRAPYGLIKEGDRIYFKDSGKPVTVRADVEKTLFFEELDHKQIASILETHGKHIGLDTSFATSLNRKRYCTLIFLNNAKPVNPFDVDKTGYGAMAAWICVNNISELKR